jgi:hypothetical protein
MTIDQMTRAGARVRSARARSAPEPASSMRTASSIGEAALRSTGVWSMSRMASTDAAPDDPHPLPRTIAAAASAARLALR